MLVVIGFVFCDCVVGDEFVFVVGFDYGDCDVVFVVGEGVDVILVWFEWGVGGFGEFGFCELFFDVVEGVEVVDFDVDILGLVIVWVCWDFVDDVVFGDWDIWGEVVWWFVGFDWFDVGDVDFVIFGVVVVVG